MIKLLLALLLPLLSLSSCGGQKTIIVPVANIEPVDKNNWLQDFQYFREVGWATVTMEMTNTGDGNATDIRCRVDYKLTTVTGILDTAWFFYPNLGPGSRFAQTGFFYKYGLVYNTDARFFLHCSWVDARGGVGY